MAAPVQFWFDKANTFYEQQAYDSAANYYEKILTAGTTNSTVYFNLGNSYFRLKKAGLALLNYEKALKLSPNDADIKANIMFANSSIIDKIPAPQQSFIATMLSHLHTLLPLHAQLWLLFGCLFVLAVLFVLFLYAASNMRLWIIYASVIFLVMTAALGFSVGNKIYTSERFSYAIVLTPSLDVKNQPDGNKVLFSVHEGSKLRITQTINDCAFVSLPTGVSGWVNVSSLGII
jgi:tetratricopeptide (TPR) repeat protein